MRSDDLEELELRVAQLEHRLKLLERAAQTFRRLRAEGVGRPMVSALAPTLRLSRCAAEARDRRCEEPLGVVDDEEAEGGEWQFGHGGLASASRSSSPGREVVTSNHASQQSIVPVTAAKGTSHREPRSTAHAVAQNATVSATSKPTHARS